MIDSHCHIAGEEFALDLDGVVERVLADVGERSLLDRVVEHAAGASSVVPFGSCTSRVAPEMTSLTRTWIATLS